MLVTFQNARETVLLLANNIKGNVRDEIPATQLLLHRDLTPSVFPLKTLNLRP